MLQTVSRVVHVPWKSPPNSSATPPRSWNSHHPRSFPHHFLGFVLASSTLACSPSLSSIITFLKHCFSSSSNGSLTVLQLAEGIYPQVSLWGCWPIQCSPLRALSNISKCLPLVVILEFWSGTCENAHPCSSPKSIFFWQVIKHRASYGHWCRIFVFSVVCCQSALGDHLKKTDRGQD